MSSCGGCGRTKRKPLTSKQKAAMRASSKARINSKKHLIEQSTNIRNKLIKNRLNICEKCSHSVQNDRDKKHDIRICHKQNRPLNTVAKLLSTACPIGKFTAST
jgi:hypothetical protein